MAQRESIDKNPRYVQNEHNTEPNLREEPLNSAYAHSRGWKQGKNTVNRTAQYINAQTEVDTSESGIKISRKDKLPDAGPEGHVNRQGTQSQGYTPHTGT